MPQQTLSTQQAAVDQLKATVQADQAQIDTAKVQLDYTTIRAPISGRTGVRLVDPGNIVRAADSTGIVGINQIDPIAVLFTLPEDKFQSVNQAIRGSAKRSLSGVRPRGQRAAGQRQARARQQPDRHRDGHGSVESAVSECRAQAVARPVRERPSGAGHDQRAATVPASVVQRGPNGLYAYVVKPDDTVAVQAIRVGLIQDGNAIVEEGLEAGTRVVTDGQYKLKPGAKIVEVKAADAAPAKSPRNAPQKRSRQASGKESR